MGGFVVVEHQVDGVGAAADEEELEEGVVQGFAVVERPEEIHISGAVDDEV